MLMSGNVSRELEATYYWQIKGGLVEDVKGTFASGDVGRLASIPREVSTIIGDIGNEVGNAGPDVRR